MQLQRTLALGLLVLLPTGTLAAGFQAIGQGSSDMGRAVVGAASKAETASTAYYNPAGMSRLSQPQLESGLMFIDGDGDVDRDAATTVPGTEGGNSLHDAIAPGGLFFAMPVGERAAVGFVGAAPLVGSLDYDKEWFGRYLITSLDLATYAFGPAVSYEVTDRLSVGFQGFMTYSKLDLKLSINTGGLPGPPSSGDGRLHVDSADQWEPAWGAGIHWEPIDGTRIGVAYKSKIDLDDLEGDVNARVGPGFSAPATVGLELPQNVNVSVAHDVTEDLTVFADYAWVDFSEFDLVTLEGSGGGAIGIPTSFHDTVGYGVAAEYDLNPEWTLQTGISYASSPVAKSDRTPMFPFDRQVRYGAGVVHHLRPDLDVGLAYEYLDPGKNKFNVGLANGDVMKGKFSPNRVQFVVLSINKRF